nr:prepilin peptidase [Lachnoclostridium phocaeense]
MWIDAEKVREVLSVENLICLAFLLGISVYDVYSRRISRLALALANILAVSYALAVDERNLAATAAGAAAGLALLGISKITGEAVGYGDGWLVMALGIYLGIWSLLEVMAAAWVLLAFAAGLCLIRKKWSRETALPMTPFITAGFLNLLAGEYFWS